MGDRLPPVTREEVPESEHAAFDSLTSLAGKMFGPPEDSPFIYKRATDGAFVGPFPFFLAAPEAGEPYMALFGKLAAIPGLPKDAREVAILTVGARHRAPYELYAHINFAQQKVGMSKDVVESISKGKKPSGLSDECNLAFDVASYLSGQPGPLPQDLWDRSMNTFGKQGTVALIHYVVSRRYCGQSLFNGCENTLHEIRAY